MLGKKNSDNTINTAAGGLSSIGDQNTFNILPGDSGLRRKVLQELTNQNVTNEFIDSLKEYLRKKTESSTIGLEEKLTQAKFAHLVEHATEVKEKFYLHLLRNQQSIAYQQIVCAMVDEAISRFEHQVQPLIVSKSDLAKIQSALFDHVIAVIYKDVSDLEYGFTNGLIEGLIFYLTGNCFIRWR